jgi:FkbM family methyltransferase
MKLFKKCLQYFKVLVAQQRLRDINENRKVDLARLLHRIDSLTMHLNAVGLEGFKSNIFTLKQRSEMDCLISEKKALKIWNTYSQYSEDLIISDVFQKIGIDKPSFLDIGAHHPKHLSNTALLYELGSTGINVEANPVLIEDFKRDRERDINLSVGVGVNEGILKFNLIKDSPALSTFDDAQVRRLINMGKSIEKVMDIDVVHVSTIISSYCDDIFPDFLSLDVEGSDFEILNSIDFYKTKPKVICVEINSHDNLSRNVGIDFLLFKNDYFHYGDVGGGVEGRNAIFIDSKYIFCFQSVEGKL